MKDLEPLTDAMVEGAAEELYHIASQGKQWRAAGGQLQDDFRGIARRVIGAGHTAELVRRSQQPPVLP